MGRFYEFKKYINTNTDNKNIWQNKFAFFKFPVETIQQSEIILNRSFQNELKSFYIEIGYGFVRPDDCFFIDRLMPLKDILNFIEGKNEYANDERRKYYLKEEFLPFYEVSETTCLTIKVSDESIYYEDVKIASSLLEFLQRMDTEVDYYLEE